MATDASVPSPVMRNLALDEHGLRWTHAGHVLAHPRRDGPAAVLDRDVDITAGVLERDCVGDGGRCGFVDDNQRG